MQLALVYFQEQPICPFRLHYAFSLFTTFLYCSTSYFINIVSLAHCNTYLALSRPEMGPSITPSNKEDRLASTRNIPDIVKDIVLNSVQTKQIPICFRCSVSFGEIFSLVEVTSQNDDNVLSSQQNMTRSTTSGPNESTPNPVLVARNDRLLHRKHNTIMSEFLPYLTVSLITLFQTISIRKSILNIALSWNKGFLESITDSGRDGVENIKIFDKERSQLTRIVDIFFLRSYVTASLQWRPITNIDWTPLFMSHLSYFSVCNRSRAITDHLSSLVKKYDDDRFVMHLILRKLKEICIDSEENRYFGSDYNNCLTILRTIGKFHIDLDYSRQCLDFVLLLLDNNRNRLSYHNISKAVVTVFQDLGQVGRAAVDNYDTPIVVQLCEIRERLFEFDFIAGDYTVFLKCRYESIRNLSSSIRVLGSDPECWPLLSVLGSYLSGEETCRSLFRELGLGEVIASILKTSHGFLQVCQECFKVLDIACDGRSHNVVHLFKANKALNDELRYAFQHFIHDANICQKILNIAMKLLRADPRTGLWLADNVMLEHVSSIKQVHEDNITVTLAAIQLEIQLTDYLGRSDHKGDPDTDADIERRRWRKEKRKENSGKTRRRARRGRTPTRIVT